MEGLTLSTSSPGSSSSIVSIGLSLPPLPLGMKGLKKSLPKRGFEPIVIFTGVLEAPELPVVAVALPVVPVALPVVVAAVLVVVELVAVPSEVMAEREG